MPGTADRSRRRSWIGSVEHRRPGRPAGVYVHEAGDCGNYFNDVAVPLVHIDLEIDSANQNEATSGIGDIFLEPFGIAWHGSRWDSAVAFGVFLDNANFDPSKGANLGAGYKSYMYSVGGTVYFGTNKEVSFSILARYETHEEQTRTNIQFGDDFHFEYGLGYTLENWKTDVGLAGYYEQQTTSDKGAGVTSNKGRVWAVGPEIAKAFPDHNWLVSLRTCAKTNSGVLA